MRKINANQGQQPVDGPKGKHRANHAINDGTHTHTHTQKKLGKTQ